MNIITDAQELARRVRLLAFGGNAPEEVANALQAIPGTTAELLTTAPEILYAHRDLLDAEALELTGQLYAHAVDQNWSAFNREDRSARIVALVRRDLGEKGAGVAKVADEWPEPQTNRRGGVDWRAPADEPAT